MSVNRLSFVLPVPDLAQALAFWRKVLGTKPSFVDGDVWAVFDHNGAHLDLAATDSLVKVPAPMVKVSGLEAACANLGASGYNTSDITTGAHERWAVATTPGGWPLVLYEPLT